MRSIGLFTVSVLAILLSVTLLVSCQKDEASPKETVPCPEGFGGSDCSQQITPSVVRISKIEVTKFPATKSDGSNWDVDGGADIFPYLSDGDNNVWISADYYQNADPSSTYSFELNPGIDLTDLQHQLTLKLYDRDEFTANELMGGIDFVPYSNSNGFPTVIELDEGGKVAFKLYVSYVWD